MDKVLLVGGNGFIGTFLADACLAAGMQVRIADVTPPRDELAANRRVEYLAADFCDERDLDRMLDGVTAVVHLVHRSMLLGLSSSMVDEIERNVMPAVRMFDRCLTKPGLKVVFVSSGGTVYGEPQHQEPIPENTALRPISVYGVSKSLIEQVLCLYGKQRGLHAITVRPSNAYGPGQVPFRGQGLVPTIMASALLGKPVTIYGDGSAVRDYIHVSDIANGIVTAIRHGMPGEIYNLGSGRGTSVNALINDHIRPLLQRDGVDLLLEYAKPRGVDVSYNVLNCGKLRRIAGFVPQIELSAGIAETWEWIKANLPHFNN